MEFRARQRVSKRARFAIFIKRIIGCTFGVMPPSRTTITIRPESRVRLDRIRERTAIGAAKAPLGGTIAALLDRGIEAVERDMDIPVSPAPKASTEAA